MTLTRSLMPRGKAHVRGRLSRTGLQSRRAVAPPRHRAELGRESESCDTKAGLVLYPERRHSHPRAPRSSRLGKRKLTLPIDLADGTVLIDETASVRHSKVGGRSSGSVERTDHDHAERDKAEPNDNVLDHRQLRLSIRPLV